MKIALNSDGLRIFLSMFSGQVLGQVFALLATLFLARLYRPDAFAIFAIFSSIVAVLTPFISGSLEGRIAYEPSLSKVERIKAAALMYAQFAGFFLLAFGVVILHPAFEKLVNTCCKSDPRLFLLAVLVSISIALRTIAESVLLRQGKLLNMNVAVVMPIVMTPIISVVAWFFDFKTEGLVIAFSLASIVSAVFVFKFFVLFEPVLSSNLTQNFLVLRANISYPLLLGTSSVLDAITASLPVLIGTTVLASSVIGNFGLAQKLLILPMAILTNTLGKTYANRLSFHSGNKNFHLLRYNVRLLLLFFLIGCFAMLFLLFVIIPFLSIVLPERWSDSFLIFKLLAPALIVKLVASSLGGSLLASNSKNLLVFWKVIALISTYSVLRIYAGHDWRAYFHALAVNDIFLYALLLAFVLGSCNRYRVTVYEPNAV